MSETSTQIPPQYAQPSRLPRLFGVLFVLLIALLLPHFIERVEYARVHGRMRAEVDVARSAIGGSEKITDLSQLSKLIAKSVGPSVVHIRTTQIVEGYADDEWAHFFGGHRNLQQFQRDGEGSGVIVDDAGFIVTNNHVIAGATQITVALGDGREEPAELLGADPLTDIAVLRINASKLIAAEWGDSDSLEVGALVWAIGNPFGLDRSVSFGIISAKDRPGTNPFQNFLQSDVAVNPGNSGGPLVNIEGKIVGITTAIVGRAYQGISFAIPSNRARDVYERIKTTGKVARGWLGARLVELTPEIARQLGVKEVRGVLVGEAQAGSPSQKAGLEPGDVILEWNGEPTNDPTSLSRMIAATEIGTVAKVKVLRDGKEETIDVPIEERPEELNR